LHFDFFNWSATEGSESIKRDLAEYFDYLNSLYINKVYKFSIDLSFNISFLTV